MRVVQAFITNFLIVAFGCNVFLFPSVDAATGAQKIKFYKGILARLKVQQDGTAGKRLYDDILGKSDDADSKQVRDGFVKFLKSTADGLDDNSDISKMSSKMLVALRRLRKHLGDSDENVKAFFRDFDQLYDFAEANGQLNRLQKLTDGFASSYKKPRISLGYAYQIHRLSKLNAAGLLRQIEPADGKTLTQWMDGLIEDGPGNKIYYEAKHWTPPSPENPDTLEHQLNVLKKQTDNFFDRVQTTRTSGQSLAAFANDLKAGKVRLTFDFGGDFFTPTGSAYADEILERWRDQIESSVIFALNEPPYNMSFIQAKKWIDDYLIINKSPIDF